MLPSGDVLSVGIDHCMHHLDAEAGAVREEHRELGHGGQAWHLDGDRRGAPVQRAACTTTGAYLAAKSADSSSLRLG